MNKRSEYRSFKTYEDIMFKKLKRACMKMYETEWKKKYPDESFKTFYKMMLKNRHLDYIHYSYRGWKNGPGMTKEHSKKLIFKTLVGVMREYNKK